MSAVGLWHPRAELRRRTPDGRALADARLLRVEDGPGRGQRLILCRNAAGVGVEVAVDRGFDLSALSFRGINLGWNGPTGLPYPPYPGEGDAGLGFMRNFDGFLVTCGLDHYGVPVEGPGEHFLHAGRSKIVYPLHGRVSALPARLLSYGVDFEAERPIIWASGLVRQASVLGEVLELYRRIELDLFAPTIRLHDEVRNVGYRPSRHAMLYHVNLGFPLLDETSELVGDFSPETLVQFRSAPPLAADDGVDVFTPISLPRGYRCVGLRNGRPDSAISVTLGFDTAQLPGFGMWTAYQSGTYVLALEPSTATPIAALAYAGQGTAHFIEAGEKRIYDLVITMADG